VQVCLELVTPSTDERKAALLTVVAHACTSDELRIVLGDMQACSIACRCDSTTSAPAAMAVLFCTSSCLCHHALCHHASTLFPCHLLPNRSLRVRAMSSEQASVCSALRTALHGPTGEPAPRDKRGRPRPLRRGPHGDSIVCEATALIRQLSYVDAFKRQLLALGAPALLLAAAAARNPRTREHSMGALLPLQCCRTVARSSRCHQLARPPRLIAAAPEMSATTSCYKHGREAPHAL
jgi:hypothetical protein